MATTDLRHAVIDGPSGTTDVVAPPSHPAAGRLKVQHPSFWCTTQAGGCGGILDLHVGTVRIPHFQHRRDASGCALTHRDAGGAYAHLAYQRELATWLDAQGYTATIEHRFDDAGRADLHVVVEGVAHTLEVQLTDLGVHVWKDRDERYRSHVDQVTWLHGPNASRTALTDRVLRDVALRIDREAGQVRIGVDTDATETAWAVLQECKITPDGVWTPHLEPTLQLLAAARAEAERRRQAKEDERARRAAEEAERRAARELREQAARARRVAEPARPAPPIPARAPVPLMLAPGARTTEQWRRLHPDMPWWGPDHPGWGWLHRYPDEQHEAGMFLAYTVLHLYARGAYAMLANPDLAPGVSAAMVTDMTSAGWLREDPRSAREPMWARGSTP